MANKDVVDMTPHPPFTPKPWPPPHNCKAAKLVPITESSDVEMVDKLDKDSFAPVLSELESVTEEESAVDSDIPTPPAKKQKAQATEVNIRKAEVKPVSGKVAEKKKRVDRDEEIVLASDDEQTPRAKKVKVIKAPVCDEINMATRKVAEKQKRVERDEEIVPASDDEQTPKAKKVKVIKALVCNEINMATRKVAEKQKRVKRNEEIVPASDDEQTPKAKTSKSQYTMRLI